MEALIFDAQDRPAIWISNLLCFHYDHCQPVHTGAGESDPKRLPYTPQTSMAAATSATLTLQPNPATNWVGISFTTEAQPGAGAIEVHDMMGRTVYRARVSGSNGQAIWDCRNAPAGTYSALLLSGKGVRLAVERFVIQP